MKIEADYYQVTYRTTPRGPTRRERCLSEAGAVSLSIRIVNTGIAFIADVEAVTITPGGAPVIRRITRHTSRLRTQATSSGILDGLEENSR